MPEINCNVCGNPDTDHGWWLSAIHLRGRPNAQEFLNVKCADIARKIMSCPGNVFKVPVIQSGLSFDLVETDEFYELKFVDFSPSDYKNMGELYVSSLVAVKMFAAQPPAEKERILEYTGPEVHYTNGPSPTHIAAAAATNWLTNLQGKMSGKNAHFHSPPKMPAPIEYPPVTSNTFGESPDVGRRAAAELKSIFPDVFNIKVKCYDWCSAAQGPCTYEDTLWEAVIHLNDHHRRPRLEVAEWIDRLAEEHDWDLTFPTPENIPEEPGERKMKESQQ